MKAPQKTRGSIKMKLQKVKKLEDFEEVEEIVKQEQPQTRKQKMQYGAYTTENLIAAVKAVKEEGMSTYKAAELYGVPKSTIYDKAQGNSNLLFQRKGPEPLLTYEDEKKLVDYLLQMSSLGYMFSISELRNLASELAVEKGKLCEGTLLSPRWHKSFRTRWPVLNEKVFGEFRTCVRTKKREPSTPRRKTLETFEFEEEGEQIQISTLADETDVCLSNYYTELHMLLVKYELLDKPQRIYCIDEVAIQYESGHPKARPIKALKSQLGSRTETTVVSLIGCGNALGNCLPPFLIYPGFKMDSSLLKGKYPGVQGTMTENGLTDYNTMKYYLERHFIEYGLLGLKKTPPVLVLYDGTKSKVNPDTIAWAKSRNIILFVLPPNSSNLAYPIEKGCFRHFKDHFITQTRIFREMYNVETITKKAICKIVSEAYPLAMSCKNLVEMFDDAGIFPYKPSIVLCDEIRTERFDRKNKIASIKKRPPGMRDKGIQVSLRDDTQIKLIKSGRRRIVRQEDPTVVDVDSTLTFLRDKKIQKMLEGSTGIRPRKEESDFSDSEDDYDDDADLSMDDQGEIQPPSRSYYMMQNGGHRQSMQPANRTIHVVQNSGDNNVNRTSVSQGYKPFENTTSLPNNFKVEETHGYALAPSEEDTADAGTQVIAKSEHDEEMDTIEQTRVAVQALQDIANDIQYVSAQGMPMNTTVQNVTLNSGRMIQVVVQGPGVGGQQMIVGGDQVPVIGEVQQIEIDSSVESIIPITGETEEVVETEPIEEIVENS
ncbi:hypothetical protein ACF0H5_011462 [Mactra antiquata]